MALHFYMNGTEGAKDGTLLSGGDLSSCLTTEGFEVASGVTVSKKYSICVRADEGETWKFCPIYVVGDDVSIYNSVGYIVAEELFQYRYVDIEGFFEIKDVNKVFNVRIQVNGNDTNNPDTRFKLLIGGTQIV